MITTHRLPLLRDHHNHPSVYAAMNSCLDIRNVTQKDQAIELIRQRTDELVFVLGWNNSLYTFDRSDLDALPPVFVCNHALHQFLVNDSAKDQLDDTYPEEMVNLRDHAWVEQNIPAILKLIVGVQGCSVVNLTSFYDRILELGVWSAHEMLLPDPATARVFKDSGFIDRTTLWADPATFRGLDRNARDMVHGIKLFADGALAARTAAMTERFTSGERGFLLHSDGDLEMYLAESADFGKPVAIHAVGDRASSQVIRVVERLQRSNGSCPQVRLEHCPFLDTRQARTAKDLGIVLSMQPNFSIESVDYLDRLSEEVCSRNQPFRLLIDEAGFVPGEDLLFGSDGMPNGAQFALEMALFPPLPVQRLTLEEFQKGYCLPDLEAGHIDIEVDSERRIVRIDDVVAQPLTDRHQY